MTYIKGHIQSESVYLTLRQIELSHPGQVFLHLRIIGIELWHHGNIAEGFIIAFIPFRLVAVYIVPMVIPAFPPLAHHILKQRVQKAGMVEYQIHHDQDIPAMGFLHQSLKILHGAEHGINGKVIVYIILVGTDGRMNRCHVNGAYPQFLQVRKFFPNAVQVSAGKVFVVGPVRIPVHIDIGCIGLIRAPAEAFREYLVKHPAFKAPVGADNVPLIGKNQAEIIFKSTFRTHLSGKPAFIIIPQAAVPVSDLEYISIPRIPVVQHGHVIIRQQVAAIQLHGLRQLLHAEPVPCIPQHPNAADRILPLGTQDHHRSGVGYEVGIL